MRRHLRAGRDPDPPRREREGFVRGSDGQDARHRGERVRAEQALAQLAQGQEGLPVGHRRLARPRRPRRLLRQGQAHERVRRLPARLLQRRGRGVRDGVQHRHRLLRGGARGAARRARRQRHRQAQALLHALGRGQGPARRLVRGALRVGGQDGRPDAVAALQGRRGRAGRRRRPGHLAALPPLHQAPRRQEARPGDGEPDGRGHVSQAGERHQAKGACGGR